jgi:parvulin-like peptidyl-prolyl isomerase
MGAFAAHAVMSPAVWAPGAAGLPTEVAAQVNNERIMRAEIERAVEIEKRAVPTLAANTPEANKNLQELREAILDSLISLRLFVQEAQKRRISVPEDQVTQILWQEIRQYPSETGLQESLAKEGKTLDDRRREIREVLLVGELYRQLVRDVIVTDAEINDFYNKHKARYMLPDSLLVRHILLLVKPGTSEADKAKIRARAQSILKQTLASGADFAGLARQHTEDPATRNSGGNLGFLTLEGANGGWKTFMEVAFKAPVGRVHPQVVETEFGFHIIKVEERRPGRQMGLTDAIAAAGESQWLVRDDIRGAILDQKREAKLGQELEKLRQAATIRKNI